jgi:hypothetical protein
MCVQLFPYGYTHGTHRALFFFFCCYLFLMSSYFPLYFPCLSVLFSHIISAFLSLSFIISSSFYFPILSYYFLSLRVILYFSSTFICSASNSILPFFVSDYGYSHAYTHRESICFFSSSYLPVFSFYFSCLSISFFQPISVFLSFLFLISFSLFLLILFYSVSSFHLFL